MKLSDEEQWGRKRAVTTIQDTLYIIGFNCIRLVYSKPISLFISFRFSAKKFIKIYSLFRPGDDVHWLTIIN